MNFKWLFPSSIEKEFYRTFATQQAKNIDKEMLVYPDTLLGYPVIYSDEFPPFKAESIILGDYTVYELVEIYRRTFWELFQEELEAWWQILLNGTGTGTPIGILHIKSQEDSKMLFTKRTKELLAEEQLAFTYTYEQMVDSMVAIMQERGVGRDEETPIHFRRSPEANLEMIRSKCMRIESMLASLDSDAPDETMLKKIRNESVDVANFSLFTAVNMELLLEDEVDNLLELQERWDTLGIPHILSSNGVVEEEAPSKDEMLNYDEITEIRSGNLYCRTTLRCCPRAVAWGESHYCFAADRWCNKSWLPKEKGK